VDDVRKNLVSSRARASTRIPSSPTLQPGGPTIGNRHVQAGKFDLLILDNFSTLVTCEDENAAAAFNDIVKFLMRIKQANIAASSCITRTRRAATTGAAQS